MKKLLSVLLMLLALTACGQTPPEAPPVPDRDAETVLTYYLEGDETQLPVSLYAGDGWSLYFPTEDWVREETVSQGDAWVRWVSVWNDDVDFRVVTLPEAVSPEDARAWVRERFPSYELIEDKRGGLSGQLPRDDFLGDCLEARLIPEGDSVRRILVARFPLEAAEGFGTTLAALADTFELTPQP